MTQNPAFIDHKAAALDAVGKVAVAVLEWWEGDRHIAPMDAAYSPEDEPRFVTLAREFLKKAEVPSL